MNFNLDKKIKILIIVVLIILVIEFIYLLYVIQKRKSAFQNLSPLEISSETNTKTPEEEKGNENIILEKNPEENESATENLSPAKQAEIEKQKNPITRDPAPLPKIR